MDPNRPMGISDSDESIRVQRETKLNKFKGTRSSITNMSGGGNSRAIDMVDARAYNLEECRNGVAGIHNRKQKMICWGICFN